MDNWNRPWFRSIFSEPDGTGSNTRVCIFMVICASLVLLMFVGLRKPEMLPMLLPLLGSFLVTVCGALYALNKGAAVAEAAIASRTQNTDVVKVQSAAAGG